ncbi:MAG: hypothetical protein GX638_09325, partial [Crenarchaeota archaeon]|nr:hypothetical protein [Thermoproteota archaeon]
ESIFDITSHYSKLGIGVQPYIKLDGKIIGTGSSVTIGTEQSLKMSIFSGGNTIEPKETKLLSGSMYAITTDTQSISNNNLFKSIQDLSKIIESKDFREAYRDEYIGLYLSAIGNMYMSNVDLTNKPLMEQYDVYAERYLGVTITSFNLSIEQDNKTGEITINKEGTLGIDVKSNIYSAVSISDDPSAIKKFFQQAGIESSYLESSVLESVTGIESISTMKLMDIAKQKNIPIVSISKQDANYRFLLDSLDISSYALKSISEKVENGYQVIVPMSNITVNSWNGIGYITYDGNDSYEFMLSNGTNGGSTSKTVQDMYMYQEYIILAFYSISLILSVITFVSAAAPIVAVLFSATVLPEGFAFTAFWFLATEYLLLSNEQSFERYLDGDATPNDSAKKLTITTFSLMWLITRVLLNV